MKSNYRRRKIKKRKNAQRANVTPQSEIRPKEYHKVNGGVYVWTGDLSLTDLSAAINVPASEIIKFLFMEKKLMVNINTVLDLVLVKTVVTQFGYEFIEGKAPAATQLMEPVALDRKEDLRPRPAIVTIMGHVDHGKTTLIDAIRSSRLVEGEAGGISQAIGAYQKEINGQKITFLDTPGHEAFSAMRSRGAGLTDIVVLVVAADDGVMPQTIEAIDHAKAAKVPIIVAINKIDKAGADPEKVKTELMNHDLIAEDYGGDVVCIEISARQKKGIRELLEAILVVAELLELKANPSRPASGTVIESELDKGEGPKATLLVQNGTLHLSDNVVVGTAYGRIRRMVNEHHKVLKEAGPATPIVITGLSDLPAAGDLFQVYPSEKEAREAAERKKAEYEKRGRTGTDMAALSDLSAGENNGATRDIAIIIKADTTGSAEAIKASLEKLATEKVRLHVIHAAAGSINESDLMLAQVAKAIIYGFNVRPNALIRAKAEASGIEIRLHRIIYDLLDEVKLAMQGLIKKEKVENVTGRAEIRTLIRISKVGTIAGCYVLEGHMKAMQSIRLLRDDVVVYEGRLASLRRFKDDVKEVREGFECGLTIENYNDIKEGDVVEGYELIEKA